MKRVAPRDPRVEIDWSKTTEVSLVLWHVPFPQRLRGV